jgi:hypothetical protein
MSDFSEVAAGAAVIIVVITTVSGERPDERERKTLAEAAGVVDSAMRSGRMCQVCISGYDADPREIDQIPEARRGLLAFWAEFQPYYERMSPKQAFTGLVMSNLSGLVLTCSASDETNGLIRWQPDGTRAVMIDPTENILNLSASITERYRSMGHIYVPKDHVGRIWTEAMKKGMKFDPRTKELIRRGH